MQYYNPNIYYRNDNNRGLLLPLLVGAAVGFPFGYIASNTNKNNQMPYIQTYPVYPSYQPYPAYPTYQQPIIPYNYQPYPYMQY